MRTYFGKKTCFKMLVAILLALVLNGVFNINDIVFAAEPQSILEITGQPEDQSVLVGEKAVLSVTATGKNLR